MTVPAAGYPESVVGAAREAARRGRLREAAELAEVAAESVEEGSPEAARLANLRGGIAFELGQLDRAEGWFEEAAWLAGEQEDRILVARATTNLGSVAHLRGKVALAGSLYSSALEVYLEENDLVGVARSHHNLGLVERELGQLDRSAEHAARAVDAARRAGEPSLVSLTLLGAAETAIRRGEAGRALETLTEAEAMARVAEDVLGLAESARLKALLAYVAGRYRAALQGAVGAFQEASRLGSLQLAGECAVLAAESCLRLGRERLVERFRRRAEEKFRTVGAVSALRRLEVALDR